MRKKLTTYCLLILLTSWYSCNFSLTKCEDVREWKVENYRIVETRCLGPAGPPYYPLEIHKENEFLGNTAFQRDSCSITFQERDDLYVIFDICKRKLTELKPDKKQIDFASVDSVQMFSNALQQTKVLEKKHAEKFIKDWNESKTSDYRDRPVDSVFFPTFQYILVVHTKNEQRTFLAANYLISDKTGWTFYINKNEDTEYFHKLWRK